MPNIPPESIFHGPDNSWIIDGRISTPVSRTSHLDRGPHIQTPLLFIPLYQSDLVNVDREMADELHDYIVFTTTDQADQIYIETLSAFGSLRVTINTTRFILILAGLNQFTVLRTHGGDDLIQIAEDVTRPIVIESGDGNDRVWAGGGYSRIFTGPGNDTILTQRGASYIEAGEGSDQVIAIGDGNITVYAGPGNDSVIAGDGPAFINGGEDDDHLTGGRAHNILAGGPGNDTLQAGPGSNTLYTGDGLDVITQLKPQDKVFANPASGLSAAGQFIAHGLTSSDMLPACPHPQALVTDISPVPLHLSGVRVIGNAQFQKRVNDDLQLLASSPVGQKMFEVLYAAEQSSGTPINIYELQDETNGLFVPHNHSNSATNIQGNSPGVPSYGGAVYYNPTFISNRISNIPVLYHELCHAYNSVTGTFFPGESEDGIDGIKPRPLTPDSELQAVGLPTNATPFDFDNDPSTPPTNTNPSPFTENGIRGELGMPLRKQCSAPPI